jgi:hypothetical protein
VVSAKVTHLANYCILVFGNFFFYKNDKRCLSFWDVLKEQSHTKYFILDFLFFNNLLLVLLEVFYEDSKFRLVFAELFNHEKNSLVKLSPLHPWVPTHQCTVGYIGQSGLTGVGYQSRLIGIALIREPTKMLYSQKLTGVGYTGESRSPCVAESLARWVISPTFKVCKCS